MGCHPNSIDELIFFKMVVAPPTRWFWISIMGTWFSHDQIWKKKYMGNPWENHGLISMILGDQSIFSMILGKDERDRWHGAWPNDDFSGVPPPPPPLPPDFGDQWTGDLLMKHPIEFQSIHWGWDLETHSHSEEESIATLDLIGFGCQVVAAWSEMERMRRHLGAFWRGRDDRKALKIAMIMAQENHGKSLGLWRTRKNRVGTCGLSYGQNRHS